MDRPFRPISPGEILQEELEARGWTQADLSEILGRPVQAINEIIAGKKAITPETAVALSHALGTSPEYWLNLECAYRLDLLHDQQTKDNEIERRAKIYALAPVKELIKRRWIYVPDKPDLHILEREVCRFLDISSPEEKPTLGFAARKALIDDPHSTSQVAWACRVKELASRLEVSRFSKETLECVIKDLLRLSVDVQQTRHVTEALSQCGVRFVIVEPLPHTRIDGGTLWLDTQSPVVALSLRYDRIDWFWFTLMHELAHVFLGHGQQAIQKPLLDSALVGKDAEPHENLRDEELRANTMAKEWLIPSQALKSFVNRTKPYYSKKAILEFAKEIGVHPAIIVGRLQYECEIPWTNHRRLLGKVRHVVAETRK